MALSSANLSRSLNRFPKSTRLTFDFPKREIGRLERVLKQLLGQAFWTGFFGLPPMPQYPKRRDWTDYTESGRGQR